MLDNSPRTLDDTYTRILNTMPDYNKPRAFQILQFLVYSEQLLTVDEAAETIAVDLHKSPHCDPKNRMPVPAEVSRCSSLIIIVDAQSSNNSTGTGKILQLAHLSVREYLTSNRVAGKLVYHFEETLASATVVQICLAYLANLDMSDRPANIRRNWPLAQYASRYWMSHAKRAAETGTLFARIIEFFYYKKGNIRTATNCINQICPELRNRAMAI